MSVRGQGGPSVSATGAITANAGTNALPSIVFSGSPTTGFFASAADTIDVSIGTTNIFRFTSGGNLICPQDDSFSIGATGATRPKSIFASQTCSFAQAVAPPAAGSAAAFIQLSSTAGFGIYFGSNAPTVSAAQGSIYIRTNGTGVGDRMYINTNGATTWTAVTTVA